MATELSADDPRIRMMWLLLQTPKAGETPLSILRECGLLDCAPHSIQAALSAYDQVMREDIFSRGSGPEDVPGGLQELVR